MGRGLKKHHKVWLEHHGSLPDWKNKREVIHHINGDHNDNRIENLQLMTQAEHMRLHMELDHKFGPNSDKARESKSRSMKDNSNANGAVRSEETLKRLSRAMKGKGKGNTNASGKRSPEAMANIKAGIAAAKKRKEMGNA